MLRKSFEVFGFEVNTSGATLFTAALFALMAFPVFNGRGFGGLWSIGGALLVGIGILASVAVHELCHAFAARAFGFKVYGIELTLWGGHTTYRAGRVSPGQQLVISLVGPLSNLVLAGVANVLVSTLIESMETSTSALQVLTVIALSMLGNMNLALGFFNLIPGAPLDGGKAVAALLELIGLKHATAGRIVAYFGFLVAFGVAALAVFTLVSGAELESTSMIIVVFSLMIATTLYNGARQGLQRAKIESKFSQIPASSWGHFTLVGQPQTSARAAEATLRNLFSSPYPVIPNQVLLAVLLPGEKFAECDLSALQNIPAVEVDLAAIASVRGSYVLLPSDATLADALAALAGAEAQFCVIENADAQPNEQVTPWQVAVTITANQIEQALLSLDA